MPNWEVENLRVTGFGSPVAAGELVSALWSAVVGTPPETINQRPREGISNAEGHFEGARLILNQEDAGRTDWLWVADVDPARLSSEFPSIGKFDTVPNIFLPLVKTWLARGPSLNRLAWAGVITFPVENREQGYRMLAELLPQVKIDPAGSFDFQYQINRPRTSRVIEGLRINRLSLWSVALRLGIEITVVLPAAGASAGRTAPERSACRLQFDVNSDATRSEPYEPGLLIPLLDEFVELAAELAYRGDVP